MPANLPTRQFGTTDMNITRVGFGAWATGGGGSAYGWGPQDDNQSIEAITHAVERGINWIDTATVYGLGHSEEVVGRALRKLPPGERPFVFTKMRAGGGQERPVQGAGEVTQPGLHSQGVRSIAAQARRRADRSLPVSPARRDRRPGRVLVENDGGARQGRESSRHRSVELRRFASPEMRGDPARRFSAAAILSDQTGSCRIGNSMVARAWDGRDLLQPHAGRDTHRHVFS